MMKNIHRTGFSGISGPVLENPQVTKDNVEMAFKNLSKNQEVMCTISCLTFQFPSSLYQTYAANCEAYKNTNRIKEVTGVVSEKRTQMVLYIDTPSTRLTPWDLEKIY